MERHAPASLGTTSREGAVMKVSTTDAQDRFRADVASVLEKLVHEPASVEGEDHTARLIDFQRRLHDAGLAVVAWPEEYGGRGLGPVEYAIVCEELGKARAPELINFVGIDVIAPALLQYVDPERLSKWMPRIAAADDIWCQLFSEPDAGSDLASLRCKAERTEQGWRINGQKVWSTWAHHASWGLLIARTGTAESRHRGISAFVVDMSLPGIEVRPLRTMTGSTEFAEVFFQDTVLPPEALIGEENQGWDVTQVMLTAERGPYAIRRSAVLQAALTGLRELLPTNAGDDRARRSIADAVVAMELLDLRIARVLDQLRQGQAIGTEAALTKLMLGRTEQCIFSAAAEVNGTRGIGWNADRSEYAAWAEGYLFSRAATIYGGSQEIQKNIVAERILGLPR
jgi:alkylation response protein AidB-like acyl-CoA dehydrogenase